MHHMAEVARPSGELAHVHRATQRVLETVRHLSDAEARAPTRLPGWTRGHVLTHLARNADAQRRLLASARTGEPVEQYPGGEAGRAAEIEAGAHRPAAELVEDLREAAAALASGWEALPEHAWDRETVTLHGRRPVKDGVLARWREVEVHHADLGLGVTPADWTAEFVAVYLPRTVHGLPGRARDRSLRFRWQVRDRTTRSAWLVDAHRASAGEGPADATVTGTNWQLLAWLLGRGAEGIEITGCTNLWLAWQLPRLFPFA
jgi:maleylpyruvate isomerase